jgi:ribosome-binding ATPase
LIQWKIKEKGASMKCGIVGLPNVGKSTLFNALTRTASAQAANYPFCTIEPNIGTVCVPDPRLQALQACVGSQTLIPAQLTFVDIAGLVRGASQGEGLGNQFLGHIRTVDAIVHVVRCFSHDEIIHVEGSLDPIRDIDTIETELALADLDSIDKRLAKKKPDPNAALLEKARQLLVAGQWASQASWTAAEQPLLGQLDLLTLKPVIYVCNVSEETLAKADPQEDPMVQVVARRAEASGRSYLVVCSQLEAELASLDEASQRELLGQVGQSQTGLDKLVRCAYDTLGLMTYFTAGPKEVRAWTLSRKASAYDAAGCIHTDFQRGFIRAEVVAYDDYIRLGGSVKAREEGRLRSEGKEYPVQDGDVILFRFNV